MVKTISKTHKNNEIILVAKKLNSFWKKKLKQVEGKEKLEKADEEEGEEKEKKKDYKDKGDEGDRIKIQKSKLNEVKRMKCEKKEEKKKLKESKNLKQVKKFINHQAKSEPKENVKNCNSSINHKIEQFFSSINLEEINRREQEARKAHEANDKAMLGTKVKTRSKVFSGTARSICYTRVPTLEALCLNILIDNHEKLIYLGNAPYYLVKPILAKCSPTQLFDLEYYNPYLTEDDDELWEWHVKREFKGCQREEDESWREMYIRAEEETKRKLQRVTQEIKFKEKSKVPTRKTQLVFGDTVPKPPRNVKKLQEKFSSSFSNSGSIKTSISNMTLLPVPTKSKFQSNLS